MTKRLFLTLILGALSTQIMGCDRGTIDSDLIAKDENGNNNIYRDYRVDYKESENKAIASATFSLDGTWGTTVRLVQPARLLINNQSPRENTDDFDGGELGAFYLGFLFPPAWFFAGASGTTYHESLYGNPGTVSFDFTDQGGTRFFDTVTIPSPTLSVPGDASLNGFYVNVPGAGQDSRVSVRISQNGNYESIRQDGSQVYIEASRLQNFVSGAATVRVSVESRSSIASNGNSLGGRVVSTYEFQSRTIQLR